MMVVQYYRDTWHNRDTFIYFDDDNKDYAHTERVLMNKAGGFDE